MEECSCITQMQRGHAQLCRPCCWSRAPTLFSPTTDSLQPQPHGEQHATVSPLHALTPFGRFQHVVVSLLSVVSSSSRGLPAYRSAHNSAVTRPLAHFGEQLTADPMLACPSIPSPCPMAPLHPFRCDAKCWPLPQTGSQTTSGTLGSSSRRSWWSPWSSPSLMMSRRQLLLSCTAARSLPVAPLGLARTGVRSSRCSQQSACPRLRTKLTCPQVSFLPSS
jgi:hypothetical protein